MDLVENMMICVEVTAIFNHTPKSISLVSFLISFTSKQKKGLEIISSDAFVTFRAVPASEAKNKF